MVAFDFSKGPREKFKSKKKQEVELMDIKTATSLIEALEKEGFKTESKIVNDEIMVLVM